MTTRSDGLNSPFSVSGERFPAYDGEGREMGFLTVEEASALGDAEFDDETQTITIDLE